MLVLMSALVYLFDYNDGMGKRQLKYRENGLNVSVRRCC